MSTPTGDAGSPAARGRVLRAGDHRRMAWRNGGGTTAEIVRSPEGCADDDVDWRVSIADVEVGGPFSTFPGLDRVIVRLGIAPMLLTVDGVEHDLGRFSPLAFPGESETVARVPGGTTQDLNLMTRRGRVLGTVAVQELGAGAALAVPAGTEVVLVVVEGSALLSRTGTEGSALLSRTGTEGSALLSGTGGRTGLGSHDAFRQRGPVRLELGGRGRVAVIEIAGAIPSRDGR